MIYIVCMSDMVLRDLDEEFMRRVRAQAALDGKSLKEWVVIQLSAFLEGYDGTGLGKSSDANRETRRDGPAGGTGVVVESGGKDSTSDSSTVLSGPGMEGRSQASGKPHQHGSTKKLTAEEYYKLSKSDQQTAIRQGRF
jgi:hypothetical protein